MAEIVLKGENGAYQFDPENLSTKIGQGGMGVVFLGVCLENNKEVAIKVLYREITSNISNVERERQSASIRLQNANLVQMLDFIELNGIYHIVSEYIEGNSLRQLIEEKKVNGTTFSISKAKEIILAVLDGLNGLHKAGVIHRDIDPSNIFISNSGVVKIMDFGIAKISDGKRKSLTGIGTILGKPHYSPPEQIKGESNKVGPSSDIYSLGITFYEMLTGNAPFNATNEYDLMKMQVENPVPPDLKIPIEIFNIIKKATEKNPNYRFQTAEEFKNAILVMPEDRRLKKAETRIAYLLPFAIIISCICLVELLLLINSNSQVTELSAANEQLKSQANSLNSEINLLNRRNSVLESEKSNMQNNIDKLSASLASYIYGNNSNKSNQTTTSDVQNYYYSGTYLFSYSFSTNLPIYDNPYSMDDPRVNNSRTVEAETRLYVINSFNSEFYFVYYKGKFGYMRKILFNR